MNHRLKSEVIRLGGDPTDPVWRWILLQGPHGDAFTWRQTRSQPPGYVGFDHLERIVKEREELAPGFSDRAFQIARTRLNSVLPEVVRRGIQVIGALGKLEASEDIFALTGSSEPAVAADARACGFELRQLGRSQAAAPKRRRTSA